MLPNPSRASVWVLSRSRRHAHESRAFWGGLPVERSAQICIGRPEQRDANQREKVRKKQLRPIGSGLRQHELGPLFCEESCLLGQITSVSQSDVSLRLRGRHACDRCCDRNCHRDSGRAIRLRFCRAERSECEVTAQSRGHRKTWEEHEPTTLLIGRALSSDFPH